MHCVIIHPDIEIISSHHIRNEISDLLRINRPWSSRNTCELCLNRAHVRTCTPDTRLFLPIVNAFPSCISYPGSREAAVEKSRICLRLFLCSVGQRPTNCSIKSGTPRRVRAGAFTRLASSFSPSSRLLQLWLLVTMFTFPLHFHLFV